MNSELSKIKMTGRSIDKIYINNELVKTMEGNNLVVNSFLNLVTSMLKGESNIGGIKYWAIGSGDKAWDSVMLVPTLTDTKLLKEIGRKEINEGNIAFLTPTYEVSPTPTNIIRVQHTFAENDCVGEWREFGIYGGDATSTKDSGILINKRHHAILNKTSEMVVERTMIFTISL